MPQMQGMVGGLQQGSSQLVRQVFWLGVALIGVLAVVSIVARLVGQFLSRRIFGRSEPSRER